MVPQFHSSGYRECFRCKFRGYTFEPECPRCGRKLRSATNIRIRGVILIFTGLFLTGFILAIAGFLYSIFTKSLPNNPVLAKSLKEEQATWLLIGGIFAAITSMGLTSTLMGIWQVIFGSRNKFLLFIFFVLLIIIFIVSFTFGVFVKTPA